MSTKVIARDGESIDRLLARFKRAVNHDGVLKELRKRERYEKPSEKKRRKAKERIKNIRRATREPKPGEEQAPLQQEQQRQDERRR